MITIIKKKLEKLKLNDIKNSEISKLEKYNLNKRFFAKYDKILDESVIGNNWLCKPEIAQVISNSLFYNDKTEYDLISFCIMPNHVHIVFSLIDENLSNSKLKDKPFRITKILQNLKKYTAFESNRLLKRTGQFWHNESYDHVIRNEKEYFRIINYILNNPVKAGFVKEWHEWKWNYSKYVDKTQFETK